ncbi:ATP-dependent DNA helicase [Nesterenkonia rhizosphaerae]
MSAQPVESHEPDLDRGVSLLGRAVWHATNGAANAPREAQGKLSLWISLALESNGQLVGKAPTGSGKGLAYLTPAFERAAVAGERTVVSTEGLALQRQLLLKDSPAVAAATKELHGKDVKTAVLKGFSNYVCARTTLESARILLNTEESLQKVIDQLANISALDFSPATVRSVQSTRGTLAALFHWALTATGTPDADECPVELPGNEWELVSTTSSNCAGEKCPLFSMCSPLKAREECAEASIVITNHHMLAIQAGRGIPVVIDNMNLGEFHHIIIDEAHSLPSLVRDRGSASLTFDRIRRLADRCADVAPYTRTSVEQLIKAAQFAFTDVGEWLRENKVGDSEELRIDEHPDFQELDHLLAINDALKSVRTRISENKAATEEARRLLERLESLSDDIATIAFEAPGVARWAAWKIVEVDGETQRAPTVAASPVDVSGKLRFNLWTRAGEGSTKVSLASELEDADPESRDEIMDMLDNLDDEDDPREPLSVVAVSATLSPEYPREAGLRPPIREVPSPLTPAYERSAVYVPQPPKHELQRIGVERYGKLKLDTKLHVEWAIEQILTLVEANQGSAMVIAATTGNAQRYAEALRLDERIAQTVHTQWDPKGRAAAVDAWKADTSSIIVGTKSLMTGVDAPGETNTLVILDRPPRSPLNPVDKARVQMLIDRGENKFSADAKIYAADAAVLIEQTVGRLIRSINDSGLVAVLDPRLNPRSPMAYGTLTRTIYNKPLKEYGTRITNLDAAVDWIKERGDA